MGSDEPGYCCGSGNLSEFVHYRFCIRRCASKPRAVSENKLVRSMCTPAWPYLRYGHCAIAPTVIAPCGQAHSWSLRAGSSKSASASSVASAAAPTFPNSEQPDATTALGASALLSGGRGMAVACWACASQGSLTDDMSTDPPSPSRLRKCCASLCAAATTSTGHSTAVADGSLTLMSARALSRRKISTNGSKTEPWYFLVHLQQHNSRR